MGRVFSAAVACPSMAKSDEDTAAQHLNTVEEGFILRSRGTSMDVPAAQPYVSIFERRLMYRSLADNMQLVEANLIYRINFTP